MNKIRSFDFVNEYLDFENISQLGFNTSKIRWGIFKKTIDATIILLVESEKFYFIHSGKIYEINYHITASITIVNSSNCAFSLFYDDLLISTFTYQVDKLLYNISPFEYLDEEDFDWGLFLVNVINDPERQQRIIENIAG
ncbi:hypothetical protein DYU05_01445 [Mucilaginibacter terrenus]|uniref:Uncharacterized protein n=1 Tax=Mucilaginibacter terrenus TaxID=2482727 RepID=A0A3E2NTI5_9SPHI|nr:hypothetical protein [Mucilaginibacter terrenus]RFZ84318.1 hypothetical protein DYU05_01445 [Mucilaginibacter terrenus]